MLNFGRLAKLRKAGWIAPGLLLDESRVLARSGSYVVVYGPFDLPPLLSARLIIVGLTPGFAQLELANDILRDVEEFGADPERFAVLVRSRVAFAGSMRANLVAMLDDLDLPSFLGLASAAELFSDRSALLYTTSALRYPVFVGNPPRNFGGAPKMMNVPVFRSMVHELLGPEIAAMPESVILPLGVAASSALTWLEERGVVDGGRVLHGFPHPSGGNGHRVATFGANRERLRAQLRRWFG